MFMSLLYKLQPVIYVQISPDLLTVRNVRSGQSLSEVPEVAITTGSKPKIVAVGAQAQSAVTPEVRLHNPFAHPRSLASDFHVAEQLLKAQLIRVRTPSWIMLTPRVVIHPLGNPAGGFTQIERRAFREMALGAGASTVHVWTGRPLTDQELLDPEFLEDHDRS
jgi:rod shape-determining protein MreB